MTDAVITWRGDFSNGELNRLHADAFGHAVFDDDWETLTDRHSLGWATARDAGALVGFVNVVWDGLMHAWLQDVMVMSTARRRGIGRALIAAAEIECRAAGCEWLHVDFDDELRPFYLEAGGFSPTNGGLINLTDAT